MNFIPHIFSYVLAIDKYSYKTGYACNDLLIISRGSGSKYGRKAFVASIVLSWNLFHSRFPNKILREILPPELKTLLKSYFFSTYI